MPGGFNDVTGTTMFSFNDSVTTRSVTVVGSPRITPRISISAGPQPPGDVRMRFLDVEDPCKVLMQDTVVAGGVTRQFLWAPEPPEPTEPTEPESSPGPSPEPNPTPEPGLEKGEIVIGGVRMAVVETEEDS